MPSLSIPSLLLSRLAIEKSSAISLNLNAFPPHPQATAIVRSSFREVMFLDSDNVPAASLMPRDAPPPKEILDRAIRENRTETPWDSAVRSEEDGGVREEIRGKPSGIWEGKAYQRLGAMMWPDYCES